MKKILISSFAVAGLLLTVGCNTDFDTDVKDVKVTSGTADFTKYVSLGNSLTSGYRDGVLYLDGQNESYPSIIAQQMKLAGGGDFTQPLMPNNVGGFTDLFDPKTGDFVGKYTLQLVDVKDANGNVVGKELSPVGSAPAAALDIIGGAGKYFNNMGVPGAKSFHLTLPGYGNKANLPLKAANPYFVRFATSTSASILDDAKAQTPTFFSLWIGGNDVLSYATSGGIGVDQKGKPNFLTYGTNDISDPTVVKNSIQAVIDGLKANNPNIKGVIANIPNITNIPFFTTVPYNPLTSKVLGKTDEALGNALIDQLNTKLYGPVKAILTLYGQGDRINLLSKTTGNPLLLRDETLTKSYHVEIRDGLMSKGVDAATATAIGLAFGQARQATSADLILLSTKSKIGTAPDTTLYPYAQGDLNKYGITFPLDDAHVLIPSEIKLVTDATTAYNTNIAALASDNNLAFVDANAKVIELSKASGIQFDGVKYTTKFVTGGTFSLDGVHLTGRGYALIANEFIKAINSKYGSTLPQVNVNSYSGVKFP